MIQRVFDGIRASCWVEMHILARHTNADRHCNASVSFVAMFFYFLCEKVVKQRTHLYFKLGIELQTTVRFSERGGRGTEGTSPSWPASNVFFWYTSLLI